MPLLVQNLGYSHDTCIFSSLSALRCFLSSLGITPGHQPLLLPLSLDFDFWVLVLYFVIIDVIIVNQLMGVINVFTCRAL